MPRPRKSPFTLTALALVAFASAGLASTYQGDSSPLAVTPLPPAAVFRPPAASEGERDQSSGANPRTLAVQKGARPAVQPTDTRASLMRRLGALPDRRHLLLHGATRRGAIPRNYLVLYQLAAERYRLGADGWAWLAAVGYVESLHGRTMAPGVRNHERTWWLEVNHAYGRPYCCAGPMQFNIYASSSRYGKRLRAPEKRSTWATYGVDANGDGRKNPHDARDAIFAAARKLARDGKGGERMDWRQALLRYNNSEKYVRDISRARDRYLRAAKRQARAVAANQRAFLDGRATVTRVDAMIPKADRGL